MHQFHSWSNLSQKYPWLAIVKLQLVHCVSTHPFSGPIGHVPIKQYRTLQMFVINNFHEFRANEAHREYYYRERYIRVRTILLYWLKMLTQKIAYSTRVLVRVELYS